MIHFSEELLADDCLSQERGTYIARQVYRTPAPLMDNFGVRVFRPAWACSYCGQHDHDPLGRCRSCGAPDLHLPGLHCEACGCLAQEDLGDCPACGSPLPEPKYPEPGDDGGYLVPHEYVEAILAGGGR